MQDVHMTLTSPPEEVRRRADAYEQEFADSVAVALIEWGFSYKRQHGYIVLEWEGEVAPEFLAGLQVDPEIEDYCVYDVPCIDVAA